MDPSSEEYTTFTTHRGSFKWKVMPFGLKNAPAEFQRLMCIVLRDELGRTVVIYIDDIIVATATWKENIKALGCIFKAFCKAGLTQQKEVSLLPAHYVNPRAHDHCIWNSGKP